MRFSLNLVTVAIPFYNPGAVFIHSINSVLLQTYTNLEVLLVNDGSTDGSLELAQTIQDPRVKVINDNKNKGLNYRLNQIIDIANGEYIARMDADDLMALDRVEKQLDFLLGNPDLDLVTTGLCSIDSNFNVLGFRGAEIKGVDNELNFESLVFGSKCPIHASLLAKKSWCKRNYYSDKYQRIEDYNLWLTAYTKGDLKIGFLDEYLYYYEESNSINPTNLSLAYKNQFKLVVNEFYDDVKLLVFVRFLLKTCIKRFLIKFSVVQNALLARRHKHVEDKGLAMNVERVNKHINSILHINEN